MIYVVICTVLLAAAIAWAWFTSPGRSRPTSRQIAPELERIEAAKLRAMRAMTAERLLAEEQLQRLLRGKPRRL